MQLAIELPDELGEKLLQQGNVAEFVQKAVKKMLLEIEATQQTTENKGEHLPITQSLIGILKGSNLDSNDYKKHLEDKYL